MKVLLDTSPLHNAHAARGIGTYTRFLLSRLLNNQQIEVMQSGALSQKELRAFKPDIVHYPYFDFFSPSLPLKLLTKTVVTIHDVIPLVFPKHYRPGKKGKLMLYRQKLALKAVNRIITDSEASKRDITKYLNIPAEKIKVIYLAANPQLKKLPQKTLAKYQRRLKLPKQYILYVGDINYNKNLPELIKTLKYLPKTIKLVCVGQNFYEQGIPEWQAISKQIALSDVADRVKFYTDILADDPQELASIYQGALAYIQPSIYEGFGLPILEAMQCQTPVICGQNSALLEVSGHCALLVDEEIAKQFAERVLEIKQWSAKQRQRFVKKAKDWVAGFSWKGTVAETVALYQELAEADS